MLPARAARRLAETPDASSPISVAGNLAAGQMSSAEGFASESWWSRSGSVRSRAVAASGVGVCSVGPVVLWEGPSPEICRSWWGRDGIGTPLRVLRGRALSVGRARTGIKVRGTACSNYISVREGRDWCHWCHYKMKSFGSLVVSESALLKSYVHLN